MFPSIVKQSDRKYVFRSQIEEYKAHRAGIPHEPTPGPDTLVKWKDFAREMGVTTRTLWNWRAEANETVPAE